MLDEPLGALDKKLREQMQLELRELQRSVGITFVFVTHDQEEALTMSDRVAVMSEGKVLEKGAPVDLYERPQTKFVAEFLGTMNFFEGRITGHDGDSYVIDTDRLGTVRARPGARSFEAGDAVTVALRPENIRLAGKTDGALDGVISNAAYLGDRTQIYVTVNGSAEPVLVAVQNLDGAAAASGDGQVSLSWSEASILLLKDA